MPIFRNRRYFLLLYPQFRSNENGLRKTGTKNRFIISEPTEIDDFAYFEAHPTNSLNDYKQQSGL